MAKQFQDGGLVTPGALTIVLQRPNKAEVGEKFTGGSGFREEGEDGADSHLGQLRMEGFNEDGREFVRPHRETPGPADYATLEATHAACRRACETKDVFFKQENIDFSKRNSHARIRKLGEIVQTAVFIFIKGVFVNSA